MALLHQPQATELSDIESRDVEQLWAQLDAQNRRPEIVHGRVLVKPMPSKRHNDVVDALIEQLFEIKRKNGWRFYTNWNIHIPPIRGDKRCPDLIVGPPDPPKYDENQALGHGLLLTVEVVSASSIEDDYGLKPGEYAQAGVPLYLIVDPLQTPCRVALLADPQPLDAQPAHPEAIAWDYASETQVKAGEPLVLPVPFDITLDTSALFQ